ncbi:MAG: VanW family protein [bacterium]|nr:VanW family protein [bacterium]
MSQYEDREASSRRRTSSSERDRVQRAQEYGSNSSYESGRSYENRATYGNGSRQSAAGQASARNMESAGRGGAYEPSSYRNQTAGGSASYRNGASSREYGDEEVSMYRSSVSASSRRGAAASERTSFYGSSTSTENGSSANRERAGAQTSARRSSSASGASYGNYADSERSTYGNRTNAERSAYRTHTDSERYSSTSSTASGRSSSHSSRTYSSKNKRRRRRNTDMFPFIVGGGALLILILVVALLAKGCGNGTGASVVGTEAETSSSEPETEMEKDITVAGISINGMTLSEAEEAVLESLDWNMKVTYNGEELALDNLMAAPVNTLLSSIYDGTADKNQSTFTLEEPDVTEGAEAAAKAAAQQWNVKAENAGIGEYNVSTSRFSFVGGKNGVAIEEEKLVSAIQEAVKAGNYQAVIEASAVETSPEVSIEQAKEMYTTIGTYTTKTTSNKDRNTNISLAAAAINGKILKPGETFSMNAATGERTYEKGYRPAGAYVNGELVLEPGGGVCQVSSTLYNAVVFAGLTTTERYAHSYEPSYVTPGEDAMISYPGLDMKFVNNTEYAVGLKALFSNQTLTVSIVGVSNLEDGVKISMESEKVSTIDPPEPNYVEDTTLEPGKEVVVTKAQSGSKWVTYKVIKKNGEVVSRDVFHNSTYKGKAATIKRNTSGTVTSQNTATTAAAVDETKIQDGTLDTVLPGSDGSSGVNTDKKETTAASETKPSETKPSGSETKPTETTKNPAVSTTKASEAETTKAAEPQKPSETTAANPADVSPIQPSQSAPSSPGGSQNVTPGGNSSSGDTVVVSPSPGSGAAPSAPGPAGN